MGKSKLTEQLKTHLENEEGYIGVKEIEGHGICACLQFLFTIGLVTGIDNFGYKGRWCYGSMVEAVYALDTWDGSGDPPGNWIKYKGEGGERWNHKDEDHEQV